MSTKAREQTKNIHTYVKIRVAIVDHKKITWLFIYAREFTWLAIVFLIGN